MRRKAILDNSWFINRTASNSIVILFSGVAAVVTSLSAPAVSAYVQMYPELTGRTTKLQIRSSILFGLHLNPAIADCLNQACMVPFILLGIGDAEVG